MRKKSVYCLAVIFSVTIFCPQIARADAGGEYTSKGIITFTPNEDVIDPADPSDPNNPIKPIDPADPNGPKPGTGGPLSIDYVSNLDFGSQKITSKNKTYRAKPQKYLDVSNEEKSGPNFLQVSDNRGTEAGWRLQVKQEDQFKTDEGEELTGAQVTFENGKIATVSTSSKPIASATMVMQPNNMLKDALVALPGSGAGTFLFAWGDAESAAESVELFVPGSTTKLAKNYSATFAWFLTEAPVNG